MEDQLPIMFARGGADPFLVTLMVFWVLGSLAIYVFRWIMNPKEEWMKLTPKTRDLILGWLVVVFLVLLFKGK